MELFGTTYNSVYIYYYLFLLLAVLTVIICHRLQHSRIGRAWVALREDDVAANAILDACTGSNPRTPSQEEMEQLLECVYTDTPVTF